MPCRQLAVYNGRAGKQRLSGQTPSGPVYVPFTTEAECNQACQEGACCEGTSCSVKAACQCQGAGKVFKGVGTACNGGTCNICSCPDIPLYFDLSFSDFNYEWAGPEQSLTGYGSQLTQWLHSQTLRLTLRREVSAQGSFAIYRSDGGCYSQSSCQLSSPCTNSGYAFLTPATYANLTLSCAGHISVVQYLIQTQQSCWAQFTNNRSNHYLQAQGDWRDSSRRHAEFSFPVCPSQQGSLVLPNPPNPGITQSFTSWTNPLFNGGIGATAFYTSLSGSVTLTPTYANPLP